MKLFSVITTIQPPTPSVLALQKTLEQHPEMELVAVGDRKGPENYPAWARFLHIDEQKELPYKLAPLLPEKHYARKNLGYLYAMRNKEAIPTL